MCCLVVVGLIRNGRHCVCHDNGELLHKPPARAAGPHSLRPVLKPRAAEDRVLKPGG